MAARIQRTGSVRARAGAACLASLGLAAAGCATLGQGELYQGLAADTGATVVRMREPMVLFKDEPGRAANTHDFAALGPLEVNRLGARRYYLWVGVWSTIDRQGEGEEPADWSTVVLLLDGEPMEIVGGRQEAPADVAEHDYRPAARWAQPWHYPVTRDQLARIVAAANLRVTTPALDARGRSYQAWLDQAGRLAVFGRYMDR